VTYVFGFYWALSSWSKSISKTQIYNLMLFLLLADSDVIKTMFGLGWVWVNSLLRWRTMKFKDCGFSALMLAPLCRSCTKIGHSQ